MEEKLQKPSMNKLERKLKQAGLVDLLFVNRERQHLHDPHHVPWPNYVPIENGIITCGKMLIDMQSFVHTGR